MKNEIKEILDKLKDGNWYEELDLTGTMWIELRWEETHLLLDYITNLQEELEEEKRIEQADFKIIQNLEEENERLKELNVCVGCNNNPDYKSRNEKAKSLTNRTIEIIKQQPSGNDEWILERLNGINYCLGGDEE